jgi:hypothetical protein
VKVLRVLQQAAHVGRGRGAGVGGLLGDGGGAHGHRGRFTRGKLLEGDHDAKRKSYFFILFIIFFPANFDHATANAWRDECVESYLLLGMS